MPQPALWSDEVGVAAGPCSPVQPERDVRIKRAHRGQITGGRVDLDAEVPADPKILLGLWIYATSDGVGSGREIARLVELHAAYRWLCGGVGVAYHRLNDVRGDHGGVFTALVTQILARLMKHDLLDLHRVAQDGTRIRAAAGASSFRSGHSLDRLMLEARAHLAQVTADATDPALTARRAATIAQVAQDRLARLEHALAGLPDVLAIKKKSGAKDSKPRVSTTDPDARVTKMPDGGSRPAFNVQFATTTDAARVIVGVSVTNRGSDQGQAMPNWRIRMGTDLAKQIYKLRAATAETVNADAKAHRGMATTGLRGLDKVTGTACLFALTSNILRFITLTA